MQPTVLISKPYPKTKIDIADESISVNDTFVFDSIFVHVVSIATKKTSVADWSFLFAELVYVGTEEEVSVLSIQLTSRWQLYSIITLRPVAER